ncbi:ricin-type beta-trefoil lectin domain protein [Streptomyces sp. NPDC052236]|uniref:ricin-type beta-trefoil lectin domain protein n=1 Tax=Streptomyces sp. NPDC052236 TaxID=3365686 RepID=UPI0037D2A918
MASGEVFPSGPGEHFVSEQAEPGKQEAGDAASWVDELLSLHGKPVLDYAALCTGPSPGAAERLAGQAFRHTYGDAASHAGAGFPWRPRLLAAVLDAAREWSADDRRSSLHPDLRDGATRPAYRAASATDHGTGDRNLLRRAYRNLPDRAQVLLWHTEVEAEDIEAVASLLDAEPSLLNPARARTLLRDECVRAHLDLAPDERCRRYNRLIDVHSRPGSGRTPAEVLEHLDGCAYCGAAVDQLDQSPDRLRTLLADAVVGFRAADYLATRPARPAIASARARSESVLEHAGAATEPTRRRRRRLPLLVAMGVVLLGVIVAIPMALSGTGDDGEQTGGPAPGPTRNPSAPATGSSAAPTRSPGTSAAPGAGEALVTRLRNSRTGLCLDIAASNAVAGAPAVTAQCGGSATQVWLLEDRGRLRSRADPGLCLHAELNGNLALRPCGASTGPDGEESGDTRFDLAADGLLTSVEEPGVAVTPDLRVEGSIILLEPVPQDRIRRSQRWRTDEASPPVTSPSQTVPDTSAAG